jgi:hypothetical protein
MIGRLKPKLGMVLVAAVAAAGCGDSTGPGDLGPEASMEIATTLMFEIIALGFSVGPGVDPAASTTAGPDGLAASTTSFSETAPCDMGGTILVQGSITDNLSQQGSGTLAYDLRQRPNGCVIGTSQGPFTVNGDPELTVTANMAVSQWSPTTFVMTFGGGFQWNGGGGSGRCAMNLTYDFDYTTMAFSASGHVCGHRMDFSH